MALTLKDLLSRCEEIVVDVISNAKDIRLEQFHQKPNEDWDVVVSYLLPDVEETLSPLSGALDQMSTALKGFSRPKYDRTYKRLLLNKDGRLIDFSMYSR